MTAYRTSMRGVRRRRLILLACVSLTATLVMDVGSSFAVPTRAPCAERPAFRATTARWFDSWSLPESVVRSSTPDRARGCWWIASVRRFEPKPDIGVHEGAADLVAALREQGYDLEQAPSQEFGIWKTRDCPDHVPCDLVVSVVESQAGNAIEAEFVRGRTRCHATVARFRLKAARVFDTWTLPEGVARSSSGDRSSAEGCWWIESLRRFTPDEGVSATRAAARLVAALREQGYDLRSSGEDATYWTAHDCPGQLDCDLTVAIDYSGEQPRLEAILGRYS